MPSNVIASAVATSGTRSNFGAPSGLTISETSFDRNPASFAVIVWSEPRGTVMSPGLTVIAYGLAASAVRLTSSKADAPCRRNSGPNIISSAAAPATVASAIPYRFRWDRPTVLPPLIARAFSAACSIIRSTMTGGTSSGALPVPSAPTCTALRIAA